MSSGSVVLPPLYAGWIHQLLEGPIPEESHATCNDCAMCAAGSHQAMASGLFFDPRTKCCTYIPQLANFLVGRILADDDPAFAQGRATVEARLQAAVAVTPLGLGQPPSLALLYEKTAANSFGRSRSLRCPHYLEEEGGRCGVWKYRASVCATWFCKYVRGATGMNFWQALHRLLSGVERNLSRWCVLQLDPGTEALERLFPLLRPPDTDDRTLDDLIDPEAYRALWGRWFSREVEFYKECRPLVDGLTWHDVTTIGGPEMQIFARLVHEAYGRLMSNEIPKRLKVGSFNVARMDQQSCRVWSYDGSDPIEMPKALLESLPYFDGRPTDEALWTIVSEKAIRIDPGAVRKLVDFKILVPSERLRDSVETRPG